MDDTPDIAAIAGLIGDRARATMLMGLMTGRSLTATELARAAGLTKQTASSHLSELVSAQLVAVEHSGRHRYFRLSNHDVGAVIEGLTGLAHRVGAVRVDSGPPDPAMRKARVCYDHLAGELGVLVFDSLSDGGFVHAAEKTVTVTEPGELFLSDFGIDVETLRRGRRALCLLCLDWSVRRKHMAGAVGAALLTRCVELGWARQYKGSRTVSFSVLGERSLRGAFKLRDN